jgi:beta-xylosidase
VELGIELPTVAESLRAEFPDARIDLALGTTIDGGETDGIAAAVVLAEEAGLAVVVLGDRAGLFGRGTSGEGCDVPILSLPGAQQQLLDAVLDTGVPTIAVLLTGRPYALGSAPDRAAAIVQAFFPGERGGPAVAGVLSGRVNPSGRLPVSVPAGPGTQPTTYLGGVLAGRSDVSSVDPTARYAFGHGLGYTSFAWDDVALDADEVPVEGEVSLAVTVRNTGNRAGADIVQLYLSDPVATIVRPVRRLVGYARVPLEAGESARVTFRVSTDLAAFTGLTGRRVIEPGELRLALGASSAEIRHERSVRLTGQVVELDDARDAARALIADVTVEGA